MPASSVCSNFRMFSPGSVHRHHDPVQQSGSPLLFFGIFFCGVTESGEVVCLFVFVPHLSGEGC